MNEKTILLVDDNQDDLDLTLRALRKSKIGNAVVVARDGVEALEYLFGLGAHAGRDTNIQPQVILMDLKMPRMGGLETLRRLRADARTRNVPVVILTSSKEESDLVESYGLGANSFVRKPVDFIQFAESVQHLNLYWLVMNEVAPVTAGTKEMDYESAP
jgi:CheY-like chemotaxis protein